jgi:hypothetical protein
MVVGQDQGIVVRDGERDMAWREGMGAQGRHGVIQRWEWGIGWIWSDGERIGPLGDGGRRWKKGMGAWDGNGGMEMWL